MRQLSFLVILFLTVNAANAQGYYFNFGQNYTKYDYKNSFDRYENDCKNYPDCKFNKPTFFYLNSFFYGTYGTLMYLNPFYIPVFIYKEFTRVYYRSFYTVLI